MQAQLLKKLLSSVFIKLSFDALYYIILYGELENDNIICQIAETKISEGSKNYNIYKCLYYFLSSNMYSFTIQTKKLIININPLDNIINNAT
jgi:hypothetical protein